MMVLKRKNERYEAGRLVKDKYYFLGLLVIKKLYSYKKDGATCITFLLGIPIWKNYVTPQKFSDLSYQYGKRCFEEGYLDCSGSMQQDMAKALNEDKEVLEKFKKLCKGMDNKSIEQIVKITSRLQQSYFLHDKKVFHLTQKERDEFEKIKTEFYPNIMEAGGVYGFIRVGFCLKMFLK